MHFAQSEEHGSQIQSQGDVGLLAGQDIQARAAQIEAQGHLNVLADRNITIEAGQNTLDHVVHSKHKSRELLSKISRKKYDEEHHKEAKRMDIEIRMPIRISLDLKDFSSSAVAFDIEIEINKYDSAGFYTQNNLWFSYSNFNEFIINLKKNEMAILNDLNHYFVLTVNPYERCFEWTHSEKIFAKSSILIKIKEKMDDDCKGAFLRAFDNFPKWW